MKNNERAQSCTKLYQDALEMKTESDDIQEFSARVKATLESVPVDVVDRTIQSINKLIGLIVKRKGQEIRY